MPAPLVTTYALATMITCGDAILADIDGGAGVGKIKLRSEADVLLAEILLNNPGGTVNVLTGILQLDPAGPDASADASGIATYGEVTDSDDVVIMSIPVIEGATAVDGYLVLNIESIVAGSTVTILSAIIG